MANNLVSVNQHIEVIELLSKPTNQENIKIVLCAILNKHEWVTWIKNTQFAPGKGYVLGHYFTSLNQALDDYNKRS